MIAQVMRFVKIVALNSLLVASHNLRLMDFNYLFD